MTALGSERTCGGAAGYPIIIDGVADTAIVLPEVDSHPEAQIEVIAPFGLRNALEKGDGDHVVIDILPNHTEKSPADSEPNPKAVTASGLKFWVRSD